MKELFLKETVIALLKKQRESDIIRFDELTGTKINMKAKGIFPIVGLCKPDHEIKERDEEGVEFDVKVIDLFNSIVGTKRKWNKTVHKLIASRLLSFTPEEILQAVENRARYVIHNDWHQDPKRLLIKNNIVLVLGSDESLSKWLEYTTYKPDNTLKNKTSKVNKSVFE